MSDNSTRPQKLTRLQELFVQEYLVDLNATQAAIRAGYSEKTAGSIGQENLTKPEIKAAIQKAMDERSLKTQITAEKVLRRLDDIGDIDIAKAYDEKGRLLPLHDMPVEIRKCIASIKVYNEYEGYGKDRYQIGETVEVKFYDKVRANELLGKHLKLFTDKVEHTGKDDGPIIMVTLPSNGREAPRDDGSEKD